MPQAEQISDKTGKAPKTRFVDDFFRPIESRLSVERSLSLITLCLIILTVIAIGFVLDGARAIMLPMASAFVISILLAPAADWLGRRGMPEAARAGVVVMATLIVIAFIFFYAGRPTAIWLQNLPEIAENARLKMSGIEEAVTQVQEVSKKVEEITKTEQTGTEPQEVIVKQRSLPAALAQTARTALVQILFTAVLTYFLLATRSSFRQKAIAAAPNLAGKLRNARIFRNVQKRVGSYMFAMLIINTGLGIAVTLAMMAIGMPSPLVWGLLAGVLNFVPYVGPFTITLLLGLSGIVNFETMPMAIVPALIYIVFNFIESNFVTPFFVGFRLMVSPLAIIVAIALLTWMWGPIGAVIAVPLTVIFKTVCDSIPILKPVGVFIGNIRILKGKRVGFCEDRPGVVVEN